MEPGLPREISGLQKSPMISDLKRTAHLRMRQHQTSGASLRWLVRSAGLARGRHFLKISSIFLRFPQFSSNFLKFPRIFLRFSWHARSRQSPPAPPLQLAAWRHHHKQNQWWANLRGDVHKSSALELGSPFADEFSREKVEANDRDLRQLLHYSSLISFAVCVASCRMQFNPEKPCICASSWNVAFKEPLRLTPVFMFIVCHWLTSGEKLPNSPLAKERLWNQPGVPTYQARVRKPPLRGGFFVSPWFSPQTDPAFHITFFLTLVSTFFFQILAKSPFLLKKSWLTRICRPPSPRTRNVKPGKCQNVKGRPRSNAQNLRNLLKIIMEPAGGSRAPQLKISSPCFEVGGGGVKTPQNLDMLNNSPIANTFAGSTFYNLHVPGFKQCLCFVFCPCLLRPTWPFIFITRLAFRRF